VIYLTILSVVQTTQHQMIGQLINTKFYGTWKEAITDQFKVLSWHLPGETEKNLKKLESG
jgi:hypothetical protein